MHPNYSAFVAEIPVDDDKAMEEFQKAIDVYQDQMANHIQEEAKRLDISEACASDVTYLRSRSRWTQDLEEQLIQLYREGRPPNIFEWP